MLKSIFILILAATLSCFADEPNKTIITLTGDVMLARGIQDRIGYIGINKLAAYLKPIFKSSDAVIINLECALTHSENKIIKPINLKADPSFADSLKSINVTHANLINNHSFDYAVEGLTETYNSLNNAGIVPIGIQSANYEFPDPIIIEKNAHRIAVFSNMYLNTYEKYVFSDFGLGINSEKDFIDKLQKYKNNNPNDFIIVLTHWGLENKEVTKKQRIIAKDILDAGANIIVGSHPHIVQESQIIDGKAIYYSLGNCIFDENNFNETSGMVLQIEFKNNEVNLIEHKLKISDFIPKLLANPTILKLK